MLGLNTFLSSFEIAIAKENAKDFFYAYENQNFSVSNLFDNSINSTLEEKDQKNTKDISLTLKIFSDKQYDFNQNTYVAALLIACFRIYSHVFRNLPFLTIDVNW